jgi:hypothetical protein
MVLSDQGRSIFDAAEAAPSRYVRFPGSWISSAAPHAISPEGCRHADFTYRDRTVIEECPPKWCIVPEAQHDWTWHWSVHNVFGSPHNKSLSEEFIYRHMKGISNNWKYNRWDGAAFDPERFTRDAALAGAFEAAGLKQAANARLTQSC